MNGKQNIFLFSVGAGMELCWLYAWASFLLFAICRDFFSFFFMGFIFGLGSGVSLAYRDRGWRRIYILLFRLLLFTVGFFIVLQGQGHQYFTSPGFIGLINWLMGTKEPSQWFFLILLIILTYVIWKRGSSLIANPGSENIYAKFDFGIAAFFVLLVLKALLAVKGNIIIDHPRVELLFLPYFIFSLLAIGSIRNIHTQKNYVPGFQKTGVMLSFTIVILLFGACIFLLFHSHLTTGAENLSIVLKKGAAPLLPVFIAVIRFIFLPRSKGHDETGEVGGGEIHIPALAETGKEIGLLEEIMKWASGGFILIMIFAVVCLGMWYLIKVLSKTSPKTKERRRRPFLIWLLTVKYLFLVCWRKAVRIVKGHANGMELYGSLLVWGRHSGVSRRQIETPLEYGYRLMGYFPALKQEIGLIVRLFNKEIYGEAVLHEKELALGRKAWKNLKRPAYLPLRMKTWFLSSGTF